MISRRTFLGSAAAASLAGCGEHKSRPNIVVLMPDQFRGMDIAAAGNPDVQTPNMDRLAGEGVLLRNAIANCPLCSPSRATLLTGKYAHNTGVDVNDAPLGDEQVTIAEILQSQGYRTGFVGKWHLEGGKRLPGFVPPGPRRQGFDSWAANICSHEYWDMSYFRDDPEPIPMPGYSAETFTEEALNFLGEESEAPFFLFVAWGPPHNPYVAPPEYMNLYDPDGLRMRPNWSEDARTGSRNDIAGYYAAISFIDHEIGRILDVLDSNERSADTIVLVTSDHGDMLGSQGTVLKRRPWEESIRVPGLLRFPGVTAGVVSDLLFSHGDVVPTLLGLAGVETEQAFEGRDFSELLNNVEEFPGGEPESVYIRCYLPTERGMYPPWRGVRTAAHTYAENEEGAWLLYDNEADPYQLKNLAGLPEHAQTERRLQALTAEWFEKTGDSWRERRDMPYA